MNFDAVHAGHLRQTLRFVEFRDARSIQISGIRDVGEMATFASFLRILIT